MSLAWLSHNGNGLVHNGRALGRNRENPLHLPPFTMRFRFTKASYDPSAQVWKPGSVWTRVSSSPNVWDYNLISTDWSNAFAWYEEGYEYFNKPDNDVYVLGANTTGVVNFNAVFEGASSLKEVCLFDTKSAEIVQNMFDNTGLTKVPLFDTSNVWDFTAMLADTKITVAPKLNTSKAEYMDHMFDGCENLVSFPDLDYSNVRSMNCFMQWCENLKSIPALNCPLIGHRPDHEYPDHPGLGVSCLFKDCWRVEGGALAAYQYLSTFPFITALAERHSETFKNCGTNNPTGIAELAQIPASWK